MSLAAKAINWCIFAKEKASKDSLTCYDFLSHIIEGLYSKNIFWTMASLSEDITLLDFFEMRRLQADMIVPPQRSCWQET